MVSVFDALHMAGPVCCSVCHGNMDYVFDCLPTQKILCTYASPCPNAAELLLESMVEQGVVDLLCSSLSAHERHQGVLAVALRTLVLLTEDGKAVCVHRGC